MISMFAQRMKQVYEAARQAAAEAERKAAKRYDDEPPLLYRDALNLFNSTLSTNLLPVPHM